MVRSECAQWDFRINMEAVDKYKLCQYLQELGKKWLFQGEQGDSGYKHWQGRISLWKKRTKRPLMRLFSEIGCPIPHYLEPTSGQGNQGFSYVMKADTRISGPFSNQEIPEYIPRQFRLKKLKPWQQSIIDSANTWNDRKINVVVTHGNDGKTVLAHYAALHCKGMVIPPMNDRDKLVQAACCILRSKQQRESCLVFIDIPRAVRQDNLPGLYAACETIKGGWTYDWRNTFKQWYQDSPVLWVFTNTIPDTRWLTCDRWNLFDVQNGVLRRFAGRTDNTP